MSQEVQLTGGVRVVAKCNDCQGFVKNFLWVSGAKCPKCKSPRFSPVALIGGALDYSIADRTKGYAMEDIRFAKMALWGGVISATQYNEALSKQKAIAERKEPVPHIGRVLVDMGAIKESDLEAILEVRCKARPATDDKDFARLAEGNKYCTEDQIRECEEMMADYKRQGRDTPPMAFLLLEKRYVKENQALAILKSQQKRRLGIIHDVRVAIEEGKPLTTLEKYVGVKGDPKRKFRMAAIFGGGGLFVFLYLFWWLNLGAYIKPYIPFTGTYIGYHCEQCGVGFIARELDTVPIKCYECGKPAAIYGYYCTKCNFIFGASSRGATTPKCTRCKRSAFVAELTKDAIAKAKAPAEKKKPDATGGLPE